TVDDHQEDWTRTAQWTSSNPAVARVDQTGLVTPVADGEVTITATAQSGGSASAKGRVKGTRAPFTWNFRNDVIAVLTKMGCNSEWIAAGTPPPAERDPQITNLEVYPASATLKPGAEQQIVVRAKYSDGNVRDVTRWVKFSSSDEGVASVDDFGHVKMNGSGEAAIRFSYQTRVFYSSLSLPLKNPVNPARYSKFQPTNFIDDYFGIN